MKFKFHVHHVFHYYKGRIVSTLPIYFTLLQIADKLQNTGEPKQINSEGTPFCQTPPETSFQTGNAGPHPLSLASVTMRVLHHFTLLPAAGQNIYAFQ